MNERIKQLAEQAGITLDQKDFSYYWVESKEDVEKFAELIVGECIRICEPEFDEPYEDMSEFGKGLVEGQDVAVEKIKQHFGVEE